MVVLGHQQGWSIWTGVKVVKLKRRRLVNLGGVSSPSVEISRLFVQEMAFKAGIAYDLVGILNR